MRLKFLALLSAFLLGVSAHSASADGIVNVGGFVDYQVGSPDAVISLVGDRMFTYNGSVSVFLTTNPFTDPNCVVNLCTPGSTLSLRAAAVGSSFVGQKATLDGISYNEDCLIGACMDFLFTGQVVAPPFGESGTVTETVPVSFLGFFRHPSSSGAIETEQLLAAATATFTIQKSDCCERPPAWRFGEVRYDVTPVPEPSTVLYAATALAGLAGITWRARRRT
jgi:MYXO-CTERM domain-containing protein